MSKHSTTHFLVYPKSTGGYAIQDCDEDTKTYQSLDLLFQQSPVVKDCVAVPNVKVTPVEVLTALRALKESTEAALAAKEQILNADQAQNREKVKQSMKKVISLL